MIPVCVSTALSTRELLPIYSRFCRLNCFTLQCGRMSAAGQCSATVSTRDSSRSCCTATPHSLLAACTCDMLTILASQKARIPLSDGSLEYNYAVGGSMAAHACPAARPKRVHDISSRHKYAEQNTWLAVSFRMCIDTCSCVRTTCHHTARRNMATTRQKTPHYGLRLQPTC